MIGGEEPTDLVLGVVGILVFVDEDIAETPLVSLEDVRMMLQQQVRIEKQVVEVEGVRGAKPFLQALVHARRHLAHGVDCAVGEHFCDLQLVLRLRYAVAQSVYREPLGIDVELGHDILHQALGICLVVYREIFREAEHLGILAQDANAHAVERGNPHAAGPRPHERAQAFAHLVGSLVRERDGKNLPRSGVGGFQDVGNAVREHARLTRTCTRKHEQGSFRTFYGFALRTVEGFEVDGHTILLSSASLIKKRAASKCPILARKTSAAYFVYASAGLNAKMECLGAAQRLKFRPP